MQDFGAYVPNKLTRPESVPNVREGWGGKKDYVNSITAIIGSSSPIGPSSSEFGVDLDDVDEDEHESRWSKPEQATVHLITSFLDCWQTVPN